MFILFLFGYPNTAAFLETDHPVRAARRKDAQADQGIHLVKIKSL